MYLYMIKLKNNLPFVPLIEVYIDHYYIISPAICFPADEVLILWLNVFSLISFFIIFLQIFCISWWYIKYLFWLYFKNNPLYIRRVSRILVRIKISLCKLIYVFIGAFSCLFNYSSFNSYHT